MNIKDIALSIGPFIGKSENKIMPVSTQMPEITPEVTKGEEQKIDRIKPLQNRQIQQHTRF